VLDRLVEHAVRALGAEVTPAGSVARERKRLWMKSHPARPEDRLLGLCRSGVEAGLELLMESNLA
jgi:hypothetical protein